MNRREFIIGAGAALVAASAAVTLESCGGGGDGTSPATSAPGFDVVSNPDNTGHNHSVRILDADLSAPPAGGVYASTGSHIHTITLSQQQLIDIANGSSVTVVSSASAGHTHTWTIRKP